GREIDARISVKKRIPVGGGLGGGSSDAAAVLMGVNDVFNLGLDDRELQVLSAPIGSDIAFFLDNYEYNDGEAPAAAIVSGFGDDIERLVGLGVWLALVVPDFGCDTRAVYRRFDEQGARRTGVFNEEG